MVQNPNNIYAANGLGIILAERGLLDQAKDFFIKVHFGDSIGFQCSSHFIFQSIG